MLNVWFNKRLPLLVALFCIVVNFTCSFGDRNKRFLIYEAGSSRVQAIMGAGIPVDLEDETVILGIVLKAMYYLPTNSSYFTNPNIIYAKKRRSISRWDVYSLLSQVSELYGFGGKSCVLRAVCELADTVLDKDNGLLEEVFHAVFTPTSTQEEIGHHSDYEYYAAHQLGSEVKGRCNDFFPDCTANFVQMFSKVRNL